jgi:hypothetical protein
VLDIIYLKFFRLYLELYIFISMGRKKIYKTDEELLEARRKWKMDYYRRNKEVLKEKARIRYNKNKNNGEIGDI